MMDETFKQLFISKLAQHMAQSLNGETMVNETYKTQRVNCKCITEYCEKEDCIYQKTENIGHNDIIKICTLFEALDIISGLYRWVTTGKEDDNDITAYYYNDRPDYKYMNEIFELLGINMKVKKKE